MSTISIIVISILLFILFLLVISLIMFGKKKDIDNIYSNSIVNHHVPGNAAPTLTEMINYHKDNENESVDYEI